MFKRKYLIIVIGEHRFVFPPGTSLRKAKRQIQKVTGKRIGRDVEVDRIEREPYDT